VQVYSDTDDGETGDQLQVLSGRSETGPRQEEWVQPSVRQHTKNESGPQGYHDWDATMLLAAVCFYLFWMHKSRRNYGTLGVPSKTKVAYLKTLTIPKLELSTTS